MSRCHRFEVVSFAVVVSYSVEFLRPNVPEAIKPRVQGTLSPIALFSIAVFTILFCHIFCRRRCHRRLFSIYSYSTNFESDVIHNTDKQNFELIPTILFSI